MASSITTSSSLLILLFTISLIHTTLAVLYTPPPTVLTYHGGAVLDDTIPVSILWYGHFTPSHKAIICDFLLSLTPTHPAAATPAPPVSKWWKTVDDYLHAAGRAKTHIALASQTTDATFSMGKSLTRAHLTHLAARAGAPAGGVALVLTAADVTVAGFCMSNCGLHGSHPAGARTRSVYVWVGNSAEQCPGQCAWPFHQPIYGPQGPPLRAPNGDVGADGMVMNVAAMMAGAVTNPFGDGFFQGDAGMPVEVAAACPGVYGKGAYPGYAGELRVDRMSGGSYNVVGVNGRKYLVPAMLDPATKSCVPVV